jgi:hypothetical protein
MANKYPLTLNGTNTQIQELNAVDELIIGKKLILDTSTVDSAICDTNGNPVISFPSTVSTPTGYIRLSNANGATPTTIIEGVGSAANINVNIVRKGSGNVQINGNNLSLGGNLTTANTLTTSGNFALTLTTSNTTNVTLPTTGTLATVAGSESLTSKTYNGLSVSTSTNAFTLSNGTGNVTMGAAASINIPASSSIVRSGAHGLTLTTTAATTATIPAGTITLVDTATQQTLSNKQMGDNFTWSVATNTTASGNVTFDANTTSLASIIASMTANRTVLINNLLAGDHITIYLRNTNATARVVTIQASQTTTGHVNVALSPAVPGAASVSAVTLAVTSGTAVVTVFSTANGVFCGSLT